MDNISAHDARPEAQNRELFANTGVALVIITVSALVERRSLSGEQLLRIC